MMTGHPELFDDPPVPEGFHYKSAIVSLDEEQDGVVSRGRVEPEPVRRVEHGDAPALLQLELCGQGHAGQ